MVGGMTSATVLTLLVIPAAFLIWQSIVLKRSMQKRELRKGNAGATS